MIDNVLIPYENGRTGSFGLVGFYLVWMTAAYVAAWLLGWARTYVLAWVSERIAADLRNQTYAHLQRLSLEFFGGKRTGDLMSRISSDTDRICNFLSINLVDFATDVLMIVDDGGPARCRSTRSLAVATLVPFPIIAWLVHRVRGQLLRGAPAGEPGLGRDDERAGRHDPRHPRGQGVRPGAPRGRALPPDQRPRPGRQRPGQHDLVVLRPDGHPADARSACWSSGRSAPGWSSTEPDHGRRADGVPAPTSARFYTRLESMSRMVQSTQRAAASAQRIFEILDRAPSVPEPARPVHPGRLRGEIELRDVAFRYGSRSILRRHQPVDSSRAR